VITRAVSFILAALFSDCPSFDSVSGHFWVWPAPPEPLRGRGEGGAVVSTVVCFIVLLSIGRIICQVESNFFKLTWPYLFTFLESQDG